MDLADEQVSCSSTGSAGEESMVEILWSSIADLTQTRLISDSIESVLGGEELMEELEKKAGQITAESLCS